METLDQNRSIDAHKLNHTTKVINKFVPQGSILERLMNFAASVPDFRRCDKGNLRHRLQDIIILMILGRTCGHVGRSDIIAFGKYNLNKLRKMGMLKNGIPSGATLCRVENGIDDLAMADSMQAFAENFHNELFKACRDREIVCIDGKAERGTVQENGRSPDIVSAYSFNTGITIATEACKEKSNEIKAVPILLDKIDISGKIVTADAMSMQKDIVEKIRKKGGDFLIELKANQPSLRYGIEDRLVEHTPVYSYTEGPELAHGRIETRTYRVYDGLDIIADKKKWGGNMTIIEYESSTVKKSTGAHLRKTPVRQQYAHGYSAARNHRTQPLVDRKHALGTGPQSSAGQYKTQVDESCPKPRHHTENRLLGVLNMERTSQKTIG